MHENRNLFLFLIEINNMHPPHQTHFTNTQDLYLAPVRTVRPVRCFVTSGKLASVKRLRCGRLVHVGVFWRFTD